MIEQREVPCPHASQCLQCFRTPPCTAEQCKRLRMIHVEDLLHEGVDRATLWQIRELVFVVQSNHLFFVFFPRLRASSLNLR